MRACSQRVGLAVLTHRLGQGSSISPGQMDRPVLVLVRRLVVLDRLYM